MKSKPYPRLKESTQAKIALFAAALIWGSSFVMMKNAVSVFPTNMLLAIRFTIACVLLCCVFRGRLKLIDADYLRTTALIGLCLFFAYSFQTYGIRLTTPGKNAFLTAVYVVLVPFVYWLAIKRKPTIVNVVAAFICLGGIGLISLEPAARTGPVGLSIGTGDALTLVGGFFYAAHIVCLAVFSRGKDPVLLTILQFAYCALLFGINALIFEQLPPSPDVAAILTTLYLAVFCTAIAMLCQNYGQKHTSPSSASLIMSLESVLGVAFSVWIYGESLTLRILVGFAFVFASIIISELRPSSA